MARATPVNAGYQILNGYGTGDNGDRINVWAEYSLGAQSVSGNYTPITVYFYAALKPGEYSSTKYAGGLNSSCSVGGIAGSGVSAGDYDFTSSAINNYLGYYSGNIYHEADGTKTAQVYCQFTTKSSYITGGVVSVNLTLPTIARASSFGTITGAVLGQKMRVYFDSSSAAFEHVFWYGDENKKNWSQPFAAGRNKSYIDVPLPLDLAEWSKSNIVTLAICLRTLSSGQPVGGDLEEFVQVVVPENAETKPTVEINNLAPINDFNKLYLQGLTKLQGTLAADGKYGADIKSLTMRVDGKSYTSPWTSEALTTSGKVKVVATAVDSRGFTGTVEAEIEVEPYYIPRLNAEAFRCLADGTADDEGEFLKISAIADFASVKGKNSASLSYQYRTEGGSYNSESTLFDSLENGKPVITYPLLGGALSRQSNYVVQVVITDSVGQKNAVTITIPSEQIYKHKRAGGKGLGLGGYCESDDLLELYWSARVRKNLQVDEDLDVKGKAYARNGLEVTGGLSIGGYPFLDIVYPVGSIYISVKGKNPGYLFGGKWEQLEGRFLLGVSDEYTAGDTGGAATHTLEENELPVHGHALRQLVGGTGEATEWGVSWEYGKAGWSHPAEASSGIGYTGSGQAHNNMPPYLAVYMWKRVA